MRISLHAHSVPYYSIAKRLSAANRTRKSKLTFFNWQKLLPGLFTMLVILVSVEQSQAQCSPNATPYPAGTTNAGTGSTLVTISTTASEGQFSRIVGILNNSSYKFKTSQPGTLITVRTTSSTGTVLAYGSDSLTVLTTSAADLYVHWNAPGCGTGATNMTTTVRGVPVISSLGATSGCEGNSITINGTNLSGAGIGNVLIGGTPVTAITTNTSTQIVATIGAASTGNVVVTNPAGSGTSAATFTAYPAVQGSIAGNTFCSGGTGQFTLTATAGNGPFSVIYNDGANRTVNNVVSGTPFNALTNPTTTTNYTLVRITSTNGCFRTTGFPISTATITVNPLPVAYAVSASPTTACYNGGSNIQVANSEVGVNYQLRNNSGNVPIGSAVAGTGGAILLPTGNMTAAITFNVLATNASTGCVRQQTGTATVSIETTAPVITCPATQIVNLSSTCDATLPDYRSLATVSDNCSLVGAITITQSPVAGTAISGTGSIPVTLTARDEAGNTSSCIFSVTKKDVTAPVITCPSNITVNASGGNCGAVVNYTISAVDNCTGTSSCAPTSIPGFTLIATLDGHAYFKSTTNANWATANTNATSLGGHLLTIGSSAENSLFTTAGTCWTGFTDQAVEGTWVWITGEPVTFTGWNPGEPNNSGTENYMEINYGAGGWNDMTGSTVLPYIVEFDCGLMTYNLVAGYASGTVFPVGTTTVTYNATDASGNTSTNCSFTVTVHDVTPPILVCPQNITIAAPSGGCTAVVTYNDPTATDNCSQCTSAPAIAGFTSLGIYNGNAYYISNASVPASQMSSSLTISSAAENNFIRNAVNASAYGTVSYMIPINDAVTEGTFAWPSGEAVSYTNWAGGEPNNSGGNEDYTQVYANGTWNDVGSTFSAQYIIEVSCLTPTRTSGLASGSTFPLGTSTVNYSVADAAGNTATCSFTVTVTFNAASIGKTVGGGSVCYNNGFNVTVAASESGTTYQLRNNATNANVNAAVAGTGGTINLPTGVLTATTTYNVLAYNTTPGCTFQLTNLATVTVFPTATVTPGSTSTICQSATPVPMTLSGASIGGGATTGAWTIVSGGGTLSLNNIQTASPDTVTYTPGTGSGTVTLRLTTNDPAGPCGAVNATRTITINPLPVVIPGATINSCQTGTPVAVTLSGASVSGGATAGTWSITSGSGTLSNTSPTATPATVTYTPVAGYSGAVTLTLTTSGGLCGTTSGTRTINVALIPIAKTITSPSLPVCSGLTGTVEVVTSQVGVNYQLRNSGNASIGAPVAGTGGTISFATSVITAPASFNILATTSGSTCTQAMSNNLNFTPITLPVDRTITAINSSVCPGGTASIRITSSQSGVSYQLRNSSDGLLEGSAVTGNGINILLTTPALFVTKTYTIQATNSSSCVSQMTTPITITVNGGGQWIGGSTGNWDLASNWCAGVPTSTTDVVIPANVTVNIQSNNATAKSISIAANSNLVMTGVYNLSVAAGGTFTNNGTFNATASTGTVNFLGNGTISGTTTFKNIDTHGALDFGVASTVSGTFTLQTGGSVTGNSPSYSCPSAILSYKPGSTFTRGLEWTGSSSGAGCPANVYVQNNTTVNFAAAGNGYICYDLYIDNGSSLLQNALGGSASLRVGRNVNITGTLSLGASTGGDIYVGGSWTKNNGAVFNPNNRRVVFDGPANFSNNGTSMATIAAPASATKNNHGGFGGETFDHIWINKTNVTDSVVLFSNITVVKEIGFTKGTFSLRNSDVTIVSDAGNTADVAPVATPSDINVRYAGTGRFVVQRYIPNPTSVRSWRLLAAPFQPGTAPSINAAYMEGVVNPNRTAPNDSSHKFNPWPGYGTHITGPSGTYSATNGFDQGTSSGSILYASTGVAGWVSPVSTFTTKVTDQQGWMLFVRGDRGFAIGNQYTPAANTILEPKGRINIGSVTVPVTAGYQVIANPYPSAISLLNMDVAGTAGKNGSYYKWDPKMFTSYTQPGKWVAFAGVGNSFVQTSSASTYAPNGMTESGEAFVIDAASAGTLTMHESDKLALSSSLVGITNARPMDQPRYALFRSDIYANNSGTYRLTDGVVNVFNGTYNNAADHADTKKFITFNTKESLSLLRDGVKIAIEKRQDIQLTDTIFFAMSKFNEIGYQFRFEATDFTPGYQAFLEDKFLNIKTPVNTSGVTTVNFNITTDSLSKAENRFKVVFKSAYAITLPVTFVGIHAQQENNGIKVDWKVANELNIQDYDVEKSLDGSRFQRVKTTAAAGNRTGQFTYSWLDNDVTSGEYYYRIMSRSNNGATQYSDIAKVTIGKGQANVNVSPNPVKGGVINVRFTAVEKGSYVMRLLNAAGQLITDKTIVHAGGNANKTINAGNLAQGIYQLEINSPVGKQQTIKIIVE